MASSTMHPPKQVNLVTMSLDCIMESNMNPIIGPSSSYTIT